MRGNGFAGRRVGEMGRVGLVAAGLLAATPGIGAQEPDAEPTPLTLADVMGLALERNRDLREARLGLVQAEELVQEAWGEVYPRVDLTSSYQRNLSPAVSFLPAIIFDPNASPDELLRIQFGADNQWMGQVQVQQPLFEARAFIGVGAAGRFEELQAEVLRGRTHEVVTEVRTLFYDLLLAQEQARLIEESVRRVQESLEEAMALQRAGLTSEYEVLRLEVELANLRPSLRRAENAFVSSRRELALELDLDDAEGIRVVGRLSEMDLERREANTPENLAILDFTGVGRGELEAEEALIQAAFMQNSRVRQAGANEDLRQAEYRVEQAEYLPRVALFGSYDVMAQQDGAPEFFGTSRQRGYSRHVGIRVTVPLFTGRQRSARVGRTRAALREARIETELARERTALRVRNLLDEVEESELRATGQALAVEQARRGYEIASAEFREGTASHLELTDAEVALRQTEFNYAEAVYDYLMSRARLDEAVGRVPMADGPRARR